MSSSGIYNVSGLLFLYLKFILILILWRSSYNGLIWEVIFKKIQWYYMGIRRCRFLFYKTALADKKIPTYRPSRRKIPTNGSTASIKNSHMKV